jgi:CDP-diglyceride synthetase
MPIWLTAIIIIAMLPLLAFPFMLTSTPSDSPARTLAWFYPAYLIGSAICARLCYPQRRELTWILIILMLLSDCSMWLLTTTYGQ